MYNFSIPTPPVDASNPLPGLNINNTLGPPSIPSLPPGMTSNAGLNEKIQAL